METEASATTNQPFLNRALRRVRIDWSDLAAMGSRRGRPIRPDLPDGDVERVRELMRAAKARSRGWTVHEIDTGHVPMLTAPQALAAILLDEVGRAEANE